MTAPETEEWRRTLRQTLKALRPEDLKPSSPCPDSEAMVSYVMGTVTENLRREVNAHVAFCDDCWDDYVALAGREKIAELILAAAGPPVFDAKELSCMEPIDAELATRLTVSTAELPPRLPVDAIKNIYEWYFKNLCADRIYDPRGNHVRFFPTTFLHLVQVKNKWGQEPKDRHGMLKKIQKGRFRSRAGGHNRINREQLLENLASALPRTKELSYAKVIASEPTWIFREVTCSAKVATEAYVRNFGTDERPSYRVMICKVNGSNRDVVTIFPRKGIGARELRNQLWPAPSAP